MLIMVSNIKDYFNHSLGRYSAFAGVCVDTGRNPKKKVGLGLTRNRNRTQFNGRCVRMNAEAMAMTVRPKFVGGVL